MSDAMEKYTASDREHRPPHMQSRAELSVPDARGDGSFGWQVARLSAKEKALLLAAFSSEACDLSSGISQLRRQLVICLLLHGEASHMSTAAAAQAVKPCHALARILFMVKYVCYTGSASGLHRWQQFPRQAKKALPLQRSYFLPQVGKERASLCLPALGRNLQNIDYIENRKPTRMKTLCTLTSGSTF